MKFPSLKSASRSYMRFVTVILCLVFLGSLSTVMRADTPQAVPESDARQHLLPHKDPVYPAIARAIHIEGDVKIAVVIDVAGNVVSQKILSGPPMLRQSALYATKQWQFRPFETGGVPTEVSTTLTVGFHPDGAAEPTASQKEAAQAWFPLWAKCRASLKEHSTQDSLNFCKAALDMSVKAGHLQPSDQLAMLRSHQNYGQALLAAGRLQEAMKEENEAVDAAKSYLEDSEPHYAMPFYWRAMVEEDLGEDNAALADLTIAEQTYRRVMQRYRGALKKLPGLNEMYRREFAAVLEQHAELLDLMGRASDAAELRAEAKSL